MGVGAFGGFDNRSLVGFDLTPLVGQYGQIYSVTLRLTVQSMAHDGTSTLTTEVHAISAANADWVEGVGGINIGGVPGDSTWVERHRGTTPGVNGTPWAGSSGLNTPGTDYDTFVLASQSFTTAPASGTQVDFVFAGSDAELTALIDAWSVSNAGLLLFDPVNHSGTNRMIWYSRQATDSSLRPQLIVEYGDVAAVPEPGSATLALLSLLCGGGTFLGSRRRCQ